MRDKENSGAATKTTEEIYQECIADIREIYVRGMDDCWRSGMFTGTALGGIVVCLGVIGGALGAMFVL